MEQLVSDTLKRQKVLLLITKSNMGGAQQYVYDVATKLPRESYEVSVALGGNGGLVSLLEETGIPVIHIPRLQRDISLRKEVMAFFSILRIIRSEDPDVLHLNSSKAGCIGALAGRLLGVPRIIFTAHGWAFNEDRGRLSRLILKTLHWFTVVLSHVTITVSHAVQQQMNWPGTRMKMQTIHLAREPLTYVAKAEARRVLAQLHPELTPYHDDTWTLSIGELHPVKQHSVAIAAIKTVVAQHPTVRHLIIGDGELMGVLKQQVEEAGLNDSVFLLGRVDRAAQLIKASDMFIVPSRSEAFGYVVLEAAGAGVPIIASNVGGIPEILTANETGLLVASGDSAELAKAINYYLADSVLATNHAEQALLRYKDFSLAMMIEKTVAVYTKT